MERRAPRVQPSDGIGGARRVQFTAILIIASLALSLVLAEIAVRVHLWNRPVTFHIVDAVYGQYDAHFGQRFRPNSRKVLSLVENGRVAWCPGARAAVDEFFAGKPEVPLVLRTGQAVVFRSVAPG